MAEEIATPPRRRAVDRIPFLNGTGQQLEAILRFVNTVAVGPLIIVVALGMVTGFIKGPLVTLADDMKSHLGATENVVSILKAQQKEQERLNRWVMIQQCYNLSDRDSLRTRCLREWDH